MNEPKEELKCPDCGKILAIKLGNKLKLWCKGKNCKKEVEIKI